MILLDLFSQDIFFAAGRVGFKNNNNIVYQVRRILRGAVLCIMHDQFECSYANTVRTFVLCSRASGASCQGSSYKARTVRMPRKLQGRIDCSSLIDY